MAAPLAYVWDGEAFKPKAGRLADKEFVVGQVYRLSVEEERSANSHRHYFASINEAWKQMPEDLAEQYPTPEHLRKRALIEANYYDEEIIDCGSNKVAPNVAAFVRRRDDFALIFVRDQFVIIRTAKSQSVRNMGKAAFQDSKTKVLEIISGMVGVSAGQLQEHAGAAA